MGSYNLNYTSSQINTLLQKGNGLVSVDTSNLVLKTTASSTYITQTTMSNTYQYGTGYALSSDLDNKMPSSNWSSVTSVWASWSSSAITRARNTIYPVNSIYINWNSSSSTPSFGTWERITNSGIIGQWANNYDTIKETMYGDSQSFSGGAYYFNISASMTSIPHRHIAYDFNGGSGQANHNRIITQNSNYSISNDAGSALPGSAATLFIRTNSNTSNTYSFGDLGSNTCSHTHSGHTFSYTGSARTIDVKQATDNIYMYVRTA